MGGIEKFIARSVKDVGADEIIAALFSKVQRPRPPVTTPPGSVSGHDVQVLKALFREAAQAAKDADGDVELHIDFK
jgi:hypothetical protein